MSFLLDTNICSAYLREDRRVHAKAIQYAGRLYLSAISLAELYVWPFKSERSPVLLQRIADLLDLVRILPFGETEAKIFGEIRGEQLRRGISFNTFDLQIAATAIAHDLTLITHNTKDFIRVPGLRLDDWLESFSPI